MYNGWNSLIFQFIVYLKKITESSSSHTHTHKYLKSSITESLSIDILNFNHLNDSLLKS